MNAVNGSDYVVHTASPIQIVFKHEDDAVKPALEGVRAILMACKANRVKRLVMTSSASAVYNLSEKDVPSDNTYTEKYWTDLNSPSGKDPYHKSKTVSEMALWEF